MQILDDMNDCTGCSACFNVCPKAAIEMKSDVEGFKFPVIDADKCVNCGLCREVCPVVSARFETVPHRRVMPRREATNCARHLLRAALSAFWRKAF